MPMNPRKLVPTQEPGVLDFAPGAAAAYSLRNLSLSYTGHVVTVRRSTDNAEADFTATEVSDGTLAGWAGADGFVKTWWDQSGNARHATQATTTAQPQIVDSGVLVTEGGKAAISFSGSFGMCLQANFATLLTQPTTIATVLKFTSSSGTFVYDGYSTAGRQAVIQYDGVASLFSGSTASTLHVVDSTSQAVFFSVYSGASSTASLNGVTNTCDPGTLGLDGITIGARYTQNSGSDGTISEIIIYPTDQTALRNRIEGNLAWYY